MMSWLKDRTGAQLAALFLVAVVAAVVAARAAVSYGACAWYGYQTDRETRYAAFVGCMVQVDTKWVPRSELRVAQ